MVLTLLSLVTAMVMPNLSRMYNSFSNALQINEVARQINGIGYQVGNEGIEFWLRSIATNKNKIVYRGIEIELPDGWSVGVEKEIKYASNGACSGGFVRIFYENELRKALMLEAPFCQVDL